jgi:redox-sensitive bicupin YhaK (pirin superfamily)
MIEHRPFTSLGRSQHGGIDTRHHFSIATYHDRDRMGWGVLRVLNDDEIAPGDGFPMHLHGDIEIVTYVRRGAITHKDSLGNEGCGRAGAVQVMSAGQGIRHSEFNLGDETAAVFQMWFRPRDEGSEPRWTSTPALRKDGVGPVRVLASGFPADRDALVLRAEARVLIVTVPAGTRLTYALELGRHAYLVPIEGVATINGLQVAARDGVALSDESTIDLRAIEGCELILVETA